ncbi:MAG: hypothetical protein ABI585_04555 [Betaproteobacteria bacterium]
MTESSLPPREPATDESAAGPGSDQPALPEGHPADTAEPTLDAGAESAAVADAAVADPAAVAAASTRLPPVPVVPAPRDRTVIATVVAFVVACVLVVAGYVALNGAVFRSTASARTYDATKMNVPRGVGRIDRDSLVAQATGNDVLIVAVATDFRARDLATIAWDVTGLPDGADARLLFNSDYTPRRVHNRPLVVENGKLRPIALTDDREWLGRITGLAIAVRGSGSAAIRVRGVVAKPLSLGQLLADRSGEWFRNEPWTGTSINGVTGGATTQDLPLPIPLMIAALIAFALVVLVRRLLPTRFLRGVPSIAALVFVMAWLLLDARWTANLARQAYATIERYGGKDADERARAAEDGELVAFLDKAKALLPDGPQRIVVLAQAHYFRGRAGWHLLPHRVAWEPVRDIAPEPGMLKPGDYVLVWRRPGAQYDASKGSVRFDNGVEIPATALLVERGSALFAVH